MDYFSYYYYECADINEREILSPVDEDARKEGFRESFAEALISQDVRTKYSFEDIADLARQIGRRKPAGRMSLPSGARPNSHSDLVRLTEAAELMYDYGRQIKTPTHTMFYIFRTECFPFAHDENAYVLWTPAQDEQNLSIECCYGSFQIEQYVDAREDPTDGTSPSLLVRRVIVDKDWFAQNHFNIRRLFRNHDYHDSPTGVFNTWNCTAQAENSDHRHVNISAGSFFQIRPLTRETVIYMETTSSDSCRADESVNTEYISLHPRMVGEDDLLVHTASTSNNDTSAKPDPVT